VSAEISWRVKPTPQQTRTQWRKTIMDLISPLDSVFLLAESREHPLHVGGLQLFEPPPGAGREFARETYEAMLACQDVSSTFRKHPAFVGGLPNPGWAHDEEIDLDYHVRQSALPAPGRIRDLLALTSQLHSSLLDRHRPLWETHLIEGLQDGRFAVYTKIHHVLVDGISALKLLQGSLSADPDDKKIRAPWSLPPSREAPQRQRPSRLRQLASTVGSLAGLGPSMVSLTRAALFQQQLTLPYRAPRTMLNVRIGGARRCAAQSWSLERIKAVKNAAGATVNDVVLAMCAGALRAYLTDLDALPGRPLIAMVPVNLRTEHDAVGGNMVGAVLCNLATHLDDPAKRLETIHASMRDNKKVLTQLPRGQAMALSLLMVGPAALGGLPGFSSTPPTFNIVVSNVPGAREQLYCNGARLDGNYPMSIALDGQALNITLATRADNLDFGLVGCRRTVPHLQRLLGHLETALKDLEQAVGV
jgi:diacylglycerol O-acyltransferase / wax synthase